MKNKVGDTYKVRCVGYTQDREKYFKKGKVYEVKNNTITSETGYTYQGCGANVIDWLTSWYKFEIVNNERIEIYRKGNQVIALNKATGEKGVAKCSPEDEFDFMVGAQLAFERLTSLKVKGVKEVKRLANVGEYIKVVNATKDVGNEYKNGDILKIIKVDGSWAYYKDECGKFVYDSEYVVLENYTSAVPEKTLYNGKVVCVDNFGGDSDFTLGKIYEFKDGKCRDDRGLLRPIDYAIANIKEYNARSCFEFIELVE